MMKNLKHAKKKMEPKTSKRLKRNEQGKKKRKEKVDE